MLPTASMVKMQCQTRRACTNFFFPSPGKVQELESSDQVSDRYNMLQQEKLTLDGRVIQLESMIRQKDEVCEWGMFIYLCFDTLYSGASCS